MIRLALGLEARRSRMLLFWLAIVTAVYAGFITVFYADVAANAEQFEKLVAVYPKELLLAFGIEGSFADPGTFLTGYVFNFVWPLVGAIAAIVLGTRVAADVDRGFADVVLSTPLARARYLAGSIAMQAVALALLSAVMIGAVIVGDLLIAPDFPTANLVLAGVHAFAFGAAIAGPATLLAVVLLERGRAAGIVAGVLVVMYLVNVVAALAPDLDWLSSLSAFGHFDLKALVRSGTYPFADSVLFAIVAVGGWALAIVAFRRRDLAA